MLFPNSEPKWAAVYENTLKKVPFLETVSSSRWNRNSDANSPTTITSVRATSLDQLDTFLGDKTNIDIETLLYQFSWIDTEIYKPKEVYEDFHFMGILTDECWVESSEDFDIPETCRKIHEGDRNAASKFLLAIHLERFNCKDPDLTTRNQIHKAFLSIVWNSTPFYSANDFLYLTENLNDRFEFTKEELLELKEATDKYRREEN